MTNNRADACSQVRSRAPLAVATGIATTLPFAVGAFKNGWIEVVLLACVTSYVLAPRVSKGAQNLLVVVLSTCMTVSGADLLLRPFIGSRLHPMPMNADTRKLPRLPIVGRWDPNLSVTQQGYGDLAAMLGGDARLREPRTVVFRTDEAGFRNDPGHGPVNLLVIGDSFSAGVGTSQGDMFSSILEHRYGLQTYNLAFPGSPWEGYVNFLIESPRLAFAPGAVVVWTFFTGNDLDDAYGDIWNVADLPWQENVGEWAVRYKTFRARSPSRQLIDGLVRRMCCRPPIIVERALPDGRPLLFLEGHEGRGRQTVEAVEHDANFPKLERTLAAMRDATRARTLDLMVLLFPTKGEVYRWILEAREPRPADTAPSGFAQAVLAACSRAGVHCLDTKPQLVEEARRRLATTGELLWWRDDTHLNDIGNGVIADFIAHRLLSAAAHHRS